MLAQRDVDCPVERAQKGSRNKKMLAAKIEGRLDRWLSRIYRLLDRMGVKPNFLTLTGLLVTLFAMLSMVFGYLKIGGILILAGGLFDILDGGLARFSGKNNAFGGFFDSIVDRYADLFLLTGLIVYYAKVGRIEYVVLSCIVTIGTVLIPYTRAKAEKFLPKCNVGLLERPERIILLAIGGIFNMMPLSLGILGVLTHVTVFQRIHYSWKEMSKEKEGFPIASDTHEGSPKLP
jgi:CDP-diacylglycerol--glycerol-3-phosphate 3-phosphatidyltransferase